MTAVAHVVPPGFPGFEYPPSGRRCPTCTEQSSKAANTTGTSEAPLLVRKRLDAENEEESRRRRKEKQRWIGDTPTDDDDDEDNAATRRAMEASLESARMANLLLQAMSFVDAEDDDDGEDGDKSYNSDSEDSYDDRRYGRDGKKRTLDPVAGVSYCPACRMHVITDVPELERLFDWARRDLYGNEDDRSRDGDDDDDTAVEELLRGSVCVAVDEAEISALLRGGGPRWNHNNDGGAEKRRENQVADGRGGRMEMETLNTDEINRPNTPADSDAGGSEWTGTAATNSVAATAVAGNVEVDVPLRPLDFDYVYRHKVATKAMGSKMARGYYLTQTACPECEMPLMAKKRGSDDGEGGGNGDENRQENCVVCPKLHKKLAKMRKQRDEEAATKAQAAAMKFVEGGKMAPQREQQRQEEEEDGDEHDDEEEEAHDEHEQKVDLEEDYDINDPVASILADARRATAPGAPGPGSTIGAGTPRMVSPGALGTGAEDAVARARQSVNDQRVREAKGYLLSRQPSVQRSAAGASGGASAFASAPPFSTLIPNLSTVEATSSISPGLNPLSPSDALIGNDVVTDVVQLDLSRYTRLPREQELDDNHDNDNDNDNDEYDDVLLPNTSADWEALRHNGDAILTHRRLQGWTSGGAGASSYFCKGRECASAPLMSAFSGAPASCATCGGSGDGMDGEYAREARAAAEAAVNRALGGGGGMAEIKDSEVEDAGVEDARGGERGLVDEECLEMERNLVQREIGRLMSMGWSLRDFLCPTCLMPVVGEEGGTDHCVLCGTLPSSTGEGARGGGGRNAHIVITPVLQSIIDAPVASYLRDDTYIDTGEKILRGWTLPASALPCDRCHGVQMIPPPTAATAAAFAGVSPRLTAGCINRRCPLAVSEAYARLPPLRTLRPDRRVGRGAMPEPVEALAPPLVDAEGDSSYVSEERRGVRCGGGGGGGGSTKDPPTITRRLSAGGGLPPLDSDTHRSPDRRSVDPDNNRPDPPSPTAPPAVVGAGIPKFLPRTPTRPNSRERRNDQASGDRLFRQQLQPHQHRNNSPTKKGSLNSSMEFHDFPSVVGGHSPCLDPQHCFDDPSVLSDDVSQVRSVASSALGIILVRLDDAKGQLEMLRESGSADPGECAMKQAEIATLIEKLASAAVAMKRMGGDEV